MTKIEIEKCEKLCKEAIKEIKESNKRYEENDKMNHDCSIATIDLRFADRKLGYAEGINQVLVSLDYKSEYMKELTKLL